MHPVRNDTAPPLIEVHNDSLFGDVSFFIHDADTELLKIYKEWGKFGDYGDIIQLTHHYHEAGNFYTIDFIGNLNWPKAGLTADIVPLIKDKNGTHFLVGIKRGIEPGIGKFALPGGFRDFNFDGKHLETGVEGAIREAKEEIGVDISFRTVLEKILAKSKPNAESFYVNVEFPNYCNTLDSQLVYLGTFQTCDKEFNVATKHKRVYETVAYGFKVEIPEVLTIEKVETMFTADDDAAEIKVIEIPLPGAFTIKEEFAFEHHKPMVIAAIRKLDVNPDCYIEFK